MEFFEEGDRIISWFEPCSHHQGYVNVLHGGIQTTLMDEVASWFIQTKLNTAGVTAKINIRFTRPLQISKGKVKVEGTLKEQNSRFVTIAARIYDAENNLCSEGDIVYRIFPPDVARDKLYYPGKEAF